MVVKDVLDLDGRLCISELPVQRADVLDLLWLEESESGGRQQRTEHVVCDHLDVSQLLLRCTLQIGYLVRVLSALEVRVLQCEVLLGHETDGSEFMYSINGVLVDRQHHLGPRGLLRAAGQLRQA